MDRKKALIGIISGTGILVVALAVLMFGNLGGPTNSPHADSSNQPSSGQSDQSGMPPQEHPPIEGNEIFPSEISGVSLVQFMEGEEAIESLAMLHGTGIETEEGYIANYASGGKAITVWINIDPEERAQEMFEVMDEKIATGSTPFQGRTEMNIGDQEAIFVTGMGQDHYYWVQGEENFWVAVGGFEDSDEALNEVYDILQ